MLESKWLDPAHAASLGGAEVCATAPSSIPPCPEGSERAHLTNALAKTEIYRCVTPTAGFIGVEFGFALDGSLAWTGRYEKNARAGRWIECWSGSQLRAATDYGTDGKVDGELVRWHSNGALAAVLPMKDGREHGWFLKWHENGELALVSYHVDGIPTGPEYRFDENGVPKAPRCFANGRLLGVTPEWPATLVKDAR